MSEKQANTETPMAGAKRMLTVEEAEAFMQDACSEFVRTHNEWSDIKDIEPARTLVVQITNNKGLRIFGYGEGPTS